MICNVPAAVRRMKLHALLPQHVFGSQQVLPLSIPSLRDDVRMLAEQQHVIDRARFSRRDRALLQRPRLRVAD